MLQLQVLSESRMFAHISVGAEDFSPLQIVLKRLPACLRQAGKIKEFAPG